MTVTGKQLNRQLAAGHRLALALEPQLARVYAEQLRKIAKQAARRFTDLASVGSATMTAAGGDGGDQPDEPNWVPPDVDELLNQPLADAQAEKAAEKIHLQAIELATPAAVKALPQVSFEVDSPFAAPLLEQVGTKGVNLGLAARDVILKVIGDSYTAGLSVPNTAAQLQDEIAHLSDTTALMQARTDLNGLANGASLQSVQILGDDAPAMKTWLATEDEHTRDTHVDADGQEVPIDQPFQVGDDLLMYPGDPDGSDAEVINCRCTLTYGDGQPSPGDDEQLAASAATEQESDVMRDETTTTDELAQTSGCANCTHSFSDHLGSSGPCTMADCSCSGWQALAAEPLELGVLAAAAGEPVPWRAILLVEGEPTADGRIIDVGAIDWRPTPLSLMAQIVTDEGHDGAQLSGRIDNIYRAMTLADGRVPIIGEGVFDTADYGTEIARLVAERFLTGVSVDLGNVEIQTQTPLYDVGDDEYQVNGEGDQLVHYVKGTILGATVCPFPAIGSGAIEIAEPALAAGAGGVVVVRVICEGFALLEQDGLTAAAAGATLAAPPLDWFEDPELTEPTPLTIDEDGRLYGHVAAWGVCHIGNPQGPNVCTTAPRSSSGYSMIHLGELVTAEGEAISVGTITLDTDHAPLSLSAQASSRHYADTGTAAAYARFGEDRFGIWAAGAVADDLPASRLRALRASKLSGDWRKINGRTEMIGVLAVNVPGFPIPRPAAQLRASVGQPQIVSLVAAGIVGELAPTEEQLRAKIAAMAGRALGRDELIRLALEGDLGEPAPVFDSELGVMDVMADICALLNPDGDWRWFVVDLAIGGGSAIVCDSQSNEFWLVPLTYDADAEPVLPPMVEWTQVENESEWLPDDGELAARAVASRALTASAFEITIRVDETAAAISTPADELDQEIALQADYVRDHGYYSQARLSGSDLNRAQLASAQNQASALITAPDEPANVQLRARLVSKGLLL